MSLHERLLGYPAAPMRNLRRATVRYIVDDVDTIAGMYPPIEPYDSGHLDVSDGHSIYWETVGSRRERGFDHARAQTRHHCTREWAAQG